MKFLPAMKMIFHGVRGSRPVHCKDFLNIGGNSTCIEFQCSNDFAIYLDGGTGLANSFYKGQNPNKKRFHILITHTHWDHILTLPWFTPLFDAESHVTFYASKGSNGNFSDLFKRLFTFGHSPQPQGQVIAKIDFVEVVPGVPITIESTVKVEGFQLNHQAVTLGYKISHGESSTVVITDTAPMNGTNYLGDGMRDTVLLEGARVFEARYQQELLNFVSGIETLVYDTHFNEDNLKPDWGHSTPEMGFELCKRAGIKRFIMFHHAPEDNETATDKKLLSMIDLARGSGIEIENAKEGDEWDLKSA